MTFLKERPSRAPGSEKPTEKTAKPASHDPATPPALLEFMVQRWKAPSGKMPPRVEGAKNFKARRNALSKRFPGELLVIPTGHEKVRSNDTSYPFRAGTDFYYLTGNLEPDCVLVLEPTGHGHGEGASHKHVLYVEPNPGKTDATFFTDRVKGELWVGPRLGVAESKHRFDVDECRPIKELESSLARPLSTRPTRVLRGFSEAAERAVKKGLSITKERDKEFGEYLSEARLLKDALEVKELTKAIDSTKRGFEDVIARLKQAKTEREVEGVFFTRARTEGNDVGYGTIAACGDHACTLHWTKNDGRVKKGDLMLLDAGVEATTLYTADITRTLPISGKFSKEQRMVYELVLEAQREAFKAVKPGKDFLEPNRIAMRVLTEGLVKWGILKCSVDEALAAEKQLYRRYTLHNVSHMLGLDVHDCAKARAETYKFGKLEAGMVLTVEPGLYFQRDDLTVPEKFRGIGVRIEDDVLVTKGGCRILSDHIPSETKDVERWMQSVWKAKKRR
jgi:Xaa-Pro aminopeptidase